MTSERERERAMTKLTEAAAEIIRIGTGDLSDGAKEQLRQAIEKRGGRVALQILLNPTHVEVGLVTPQQDTEPAYVWLFEIQTGSPNETEH